MSNPKIFNVFLGDEPVGVGYPTFEAAQAAARKIAREHGSLPYEVRPVTHDPRCEEE
jgi:hypothetical protein